MHWDYGEYSCRAAWLDLAEERGTLAHQCCSKGTPLPVSVRVTHNRVPFHHPAFSIPDLLLQCPAFSIPDLLSTSRSLPSPSDDSSSRVLFLFSLPGPPPPRPVFNVSARSDSLSVYRGERGGGVVHHHHRRAGCGASRRCPPLPPPPSTLAVPPLSLLRVTSAVHSLPPPCDVCCPTLSLLRVTSAVHSLPPPCDVCCPLSPSSITWRSRSRGSCSGPGGSSVFLASADRSAQVRHSRRNSSSEVSLERVSDMEYRLRVYGCQEEDAGGHYCIVTPWVRSREGGWSQQETVTSAMMSLSVRMDLLSAFQGSAADRSRTVAPRRPLVLPHRILQFPLLL
ncbi:unnamed protein product [Ranitomeya imitator]|uniref:Ig-like domain-containing protein n=1 Tax=Ranitomeya imitator TaxID=111125 RepID=A0ABN9LTA8_9NEOB|nr:unnamed protein product [Ranitomeya imitator]